VNSDDELAQRGRAIFERLREATTEDAAPGHEEPSEPVGDQDDAVGVSLPAPETGAEAVPTPESEPAGGEPDDRAIEGLGLEAPEGMTAGGEAVEGEETAADAPGFPAAEEAGTAPSVDDDPVEAGDGGAHVGDAVEHSPAEPDAGPTAAVPEGSVEEEAVDPIDAASPGPGLSDGGDHDAGPGDEADVPPIATVVEESTSPADVGDSAHAGSGERDEPVVVDDGEVPQLAPAVAPTPASFVRALPRVMAIANQKGGVGKTTTAVNLSAALAELGYRVLVIDLDPQGNATTGLGVNPRNLESSVYDVLMHDVALEDCIEPTSLRNLFVVPATIDLAGAEIELVPSFSRELKLRKALEAVIDDFDFVLIDCPPSLGLITVNGLAAATEVVVPIQCEYYALEGLGQLLRNVNLVQGNLNPKLEVSAIILTMYDARTKLADQVATEVRTHFGTKVCRNIVPRTVRLSEAPSFGQPIIVFDPSSRGAIAYRELAKEVSGGAPQRVG
jgi:chromosome partitioning protein